MVLGFLRPKPFEPRFPIIPLRADRAQVIALLETHAEVKEEEPSSNSSSIADTVLVADNGECRVAVGMFNGKARFTNYLTEDFNATERQRAKKLRWFVEYYGGIDEFNEPTEVSFMIWWRNPVKQILILFGLHLGPVRIIDEDRDYWSSDNN